MKWFSVSLLTFVWMVSICSAEWQKIEVIDAVNRSAVCNDGSPAVYYIERGSGDGARRWVILLMGGGFCSSYSCDGRHPEVMSSLYTPETPELTDGLLSSSSAENPDFYSANRVFIHYCSSDLWSGNRLETRGYRPIQFRGRKIFRFVIKDLISQSEFHLSEPGTEILLAGESAGGLGVMANLDWLAERLPQAKVRGLNDAGWVVKSKPTRDLVQSIADGMPIWGGKVDQDCAVAKRETNSECYLSTAFPYITTPLFIQESQRDPVFAGRNPNAFGKALRKSLVPVEAAFSPRTETHVLCRHHEFTSIQLNGYSLAQLLGNWFFDRPGPVKVIKE